MIINNVHHKLHPSFMDFARQMFQLFSCTVFRIYASVIGDRVGTAQGSLFIFLSNRVNRHQPYNIRSQRPDPVQILFHSGKIPFCGMVSYIY